MRTYLTEAYLSDAVQSRLRVVLIEADAALLVADHKVLSVLSEGAVGHFAVSGESRVVEAADVLPDRHEFKR